MRHSFKSKGVYLVLAVLLGWTVVAACGNGDLRPERMNESRLDKRPGPGPTSPSDRKAQDLSDQDVSERHFTGRTLKNEEASKLANSIVVGKIVSLGEANAGAAGQTYYGYVKIEVLRRVKGISTETISLSLTVQKISPRFHEDDPEVNQTYLIFVRKRPGETRGIKLIEATDANIVAVTRLVTTARRKR